MARDSPSPGEARDESLVAFTTDDERNPYDDPDESPEVLGHLLGRVTQP